MLPQSHAVRGRPEGARGNVEREENVARQRKKASWWAAAGAVVCAASAGYAQTTSLDREVKAAAGREVRVGIYTSMRANCTAGPWPAIRPSVAPKNGTVTVRRATLKATNVKQCLAAELAVLVAFYRSSVSNGANEGQRI